MATTAAFRIGSHLRQRHVLPVLLGVEAGDERPVGGEELGRLGRGRRGGDVDPVGAPAPRQGERDDEGEATEHGAIQLLSDALRQDGRSVELRFLTVTEASHSSGAPGPGHRRSRPHRRSGGHQPHLRGRPAQEAGPGRAAAGQARASTRRPRTSTSGSPSSSASSASSRTSATPPCSSWATSPPRSATPPAGRPPAPAWPPEQIEANLVTYQAQAGLILRPDRLEVAPQLRMARAPSGPTGSSAWPARPPSPRCWNGTTSPSATPPARRSR